MVIPSTVSSNESKSSSLPTEEIADGIKNKVLMASWIIAKANLRSPEATPTADNLRLRLKTDSSHY